MTTANADEDERSTATDASTAEDSGDTMNDIAEWARPAYAAAYRDYLLDGARYGHDEEGMMRWISEQVEQQRRKARQRDDR